MLFSFLLFDRPDAAALPTSVLAEHRTYLGEMAGQIAFAGPLFGTDGKSTAGSLLVMDFADRAAADAWLRDEPFTKAGVYGTSHVHVFQNRWPQRVGFPEV